jgi:hypothetical protein
VRDPDGEEVRKRSGGARFVVASVRVDLDLAAVLG